MRQAEKERKNFTSEFRSNPTRARKFRKKLQKPLSDIDFSQNGLRQAVIEKKKFYSRIPFILDPGKKSPKKIAKKLKKLKKPLSDITFYQDGMRQAEKEKKKKFTSEFRSCSTVARKFRKNSKKIEKN